MKLPGPQALTERIATGCRKLLITPTSWGYEFSSFQGNIMPTKKASKKSSASSGASKSSAQKSTSKQTASKSSAGKTGAAKKSSAKRSSGTTKKLKETAVKVLAGAAAGAVRAVIPPLEEVAGTSEETAGINNQSSKKQASKKGSKAAGKASAKSKK